MRDLIKIARMLEQEVFKSEDICLGDCSANLDLAGKVVISDSGKGQDHGVWVVICPGHQGKEPVHLLKKRILHVAPSVTSSLDR